MSLSNAVVTSTNMQLSPMRVTYNSVDLGGTLGNVVVNIETDKAEIHADQLGSSVLDRRFAGLKITVTTEIAEVALKSNFKVAFPNAQLITSGTGGVYFSSQIGAGDLNLSAILKLHPLSLADADLTQDYLFYKATAEGKSTPTYGPHEQAKVKIVWNIYPDTSVVPAKFMFYGDPANGLVAASAAAAVAGTNTGNGTIDTIAAYSGSTKTETITISCVGASSGNNFDVSGSISGPLGGFHIAAASGSTATFTSSVISFTAHQGTVQFAFNDSFTIATTAANYS